VFVFVLHVGVSVGQFASAVHCTQVLVTGSQTGELLGQSAFVEHDETQMPLPLQNGVGAEHCEFDVHSTQRFVVGLQIFAGDWHCESKVQSGVQLCVTGLQYGADEVQSVPLLHWMHVSVFVSQIGVVPVHAPV
jgi:hypothetical protein